jgi:hypothetical protein
MNIFRAAPALLGGILFLSSCAGEPQKIVFDPSSSPDPLLINPSDEAPGSETISETQNGPGSSLPLWVDRFLESGAAGVEALASYSGKYVFIAENRGSNFAALGQWASGFAAAQDFPRLAAARIEKKLIAAASLYPDDEYGDFFENFIKAASDAAYSGAVKEETFWIKRGTPPGLEYLRAGEVYYFFVLISIDKRALQSQIRDIMATIKAAPAKDQADTISRIRQIFFEGF